jgi:mannose-6-phosphate isomerase-like protein (cupin superfamily)
LSTQVIGPDDGRGILNDFVIFKLMGEDAGGRFALVEHRLAPGQLAAPIHTHQHEDEYSFVLEGELSALLGGELMRAGPGALVAKPRHQLHTFWNQGPGILRILEIISPGGFEHYFDDIAEVFAANPGQPDMAALAVLAERYGLTFDMSSLEEIKQKYGVALPS